MTLGHIVWHLWGDLTFLFMWRWARTIVRLGGNTRAGGRVCEVCGGVYRWGRLWDGKTS